MSTTGPDPGDPSRAGWSDDATLAAGSSPPRADEQHPFRLDLAGRYLPVDVVGRGGMGEVVVAHDRRLGRDVALKRMAGGVDSDALSGRLLREAWVTARLEHPSIVPLYDAGIGDDGRMFYTMRLIHGRSLADAIDEAKHLGDRLSLLRHFLAVCQAVGYAHSHGIVHRDLKPANVMVGAFGETQLVDWGLAGFASERTASDFASAGGLPLGLTSAGALGTPAYMSPEQARGGAVDPRSDVWSLGAMLHELVSRKRLVLGPTPDEVLSRLRAGDLHGLLDRSALRPSGAPGELVAIVEKATATDPAARYRDGGEMAADLTRYLDGARVHAHSYTTWELMVRLVRQLRVPLMVAATGMLAGTVVLLGTFRRIDAERSRALHAERSARAALDDGRRTTSWALARQAVTELGRGAIPEADILAAHALLRGESPDARGVLAATTASPRATAAGTFLLEGCTRVAPASWRTALCEADDGVSLWELEPLRRRWHRPLLTYKAFASATGERDSRVVVVSGADGVVFLDARTGEILQRHRAPLATGSISMPVETTEGSHLAVTAGRTLTIIAVDEGRRVFEDKPCGAAEVAGVAGGRGAFLVACGDGRVVRLDARTHELALRLDLPALAQVHVMAVALSSDETRLVVGGARGDLAVIDLRQGTLLRRFPATAGAIVEVAFVEGARPMVAAATSTGIGVWDQEAQVELVRLPSVSGTRFVVDPRGLITGGTRAGRWLLGGLVAPRIFSAPAGLAALAVSPDGRLLAAARGDGKVTLWDRTSGALFRELGIGSGVVKAVDFSPDGRSLAAAISTSGIPIQLFSTGGLGAPLATGAQPARRLAYDRDGSVIAAHYGPVLSRIAPDGSAESIPSAEMIDLAAAPDRSGIYVLAKDGSFHRVTGRSLETLGHVPGAFALAPSSRGARMAVARESGIALYEMQAGPRLVRTISDVSPRLTDIAFSPDDRYLAGGHADGNITLWRVEDGQVVAILRGHHDRVAQLSFASAGELLSASWDGKVHAWRLAVLEVPASELVTRAEAAWPGGLTLATDAPVP